MPPIYRPWMAHWTQRGKPVRFVVRDPEGRLHGFTNRDDAEAIGDPDDILDVDAAEVKS